MRLLSKQKTVYQRADALAPAGTACQRATEAMIQHRKDTNPSHMYEETFLKELSLSAHTSCMQRESHRILRK
ncbi:hypothetical protein C0674_00680 [Sporolactobacillus terrae]|uniref:Uncharacterized protein n=1 Tax=Sporolactobacillus terrae TaxID=269673 RepID=A0ABX5Q3Q0_9BACL|nr:hypothetical protein C0674_00680 [Sporolactobacillus terrae]QAA24242.1 hypothetical protein C0679_00660 [Sporolactobacillus terrae]